MGPFINDSPVGLLHVGWCVHLKPDTREIPGENSCPGICKVAF